MQEFRQEPTEEQAEEILRLAARKTGLTPQSNVRESMRRTAAELGISEQALEEAEREYLAESARRNELEEFRQYRLRGWRAHLTSYVCVNAMLMLINVFTSPNEFWAVMPLLGWGIGMAIHTVNALSRNIDENDREFLEWRQTRANLHG